MRHENNKYSYANIEQFQRSSEPESVYDSLQSIVQNNNSKILWGIGLAGIAAGATLYLLRTERGKDLSSQISSTVSDGMTKAQERVNDVMNKVKDSVMELANRWTGDLTETGDVNPATSGDRLRRVI